MATQIGNKHLEYLLREHPECTICQAQLDTLVGFINGEPEGWTQGERNRILGLLLGNIKRHLKAGKHRKLVISI